MLSTYHPTITGGVPLILTNVVTSSSKFLWRKYTKWKNLHHSTKRFKVYSHYDDLVNHYILVNKRNDTTV